MGNRETFEWGRAGQVRTPYLPNTEGVSFNPCTQTGHGDRRGRSGLKGRSGDAMQPNGREADMRKLIVLVMAVLLVLSAMACGASDEDLQAEYDRGYAAGDAAAKTTTVAVACG